MKRKNEAILQNVILENVLRYLFDKLKEISGEIIEETHSDGTIYYYAIQNLFSTNSNKIEVKFTTSVTPQGDIEKSHGYWGDKVAMSFEGLQLQINTVSIKAECHHLFIVSIFDKYWADMLRDFGASQPANIDREKITLGELESLVEKGDKEAIEFWEKEVTPELEELRKALILATEKTFENDPAKPLFELLKSMSTSKNPLHRAIVKPYGDWSFARLKRDGAKNLADELSKSAKELPTPSDAERAMNTLADDVGGTAIYRRDAQGKIIPYEVNPNKGFVFEIGHDSIALKPDSQIRLNHTTGNFQPGVYPPQAKDTIIKVASETLAGLVENANTQAAQVGVEKVEKLTIENTRIPTGKYDELCIRWVNRPYIPNQNKDEFLSEHASELDKKTFDRILKDAHKRKVIDKINGRYKPKTVS